MTPRPFTEASARAWMNAQLASGGFIDACGEVEVTQLAEACAEAFDVADEGGPLDDPDHWIWDAAANAAAAAEAAGGLA